MADQERPDPRIEALLSRLSHAANLGIAPEDLLTRAIDGLLQVTRARMGVACLADAEARTMRVVSTRGIRPAVAGALRREISLEIDRDSGRFSEPIRFGDEKFPGLEALHSKLRAEGAAGGMLLPLGSEGHPLGLLIAMFRRDSEPARAFPDSDLAHLGRHLSTALQNARVRRGLQSANADLLRLLTLAKILGEPRELEDTLTMVAQAARSFSGAAATVVWLSNPAERSLTRIVLVEPKGPGRYPRVKLAYGEGGAGWVAESEEALLLDDALSDPRLVSTEWARSRGIRSLYCYPLRFKDALVGVLSVWTSVPLLPNQLSLLGIYSDHAALAIGHARLLREKEVYTEQVSSLMAVAKTINEGRPLAVWMRSISEACRRAIGAPWVSVWGVDAEARECFLLDADPATQGVPGGQERVSYGSGFVGWTALHRAARVTAEVSGDPLAADPGWYRNLGIRASVALPLVVDDALIGVLHLGTRAPLTSDQIYLVEGYAALAAAALARSGRTPSRGRIRSAREEP